MAAGSLPTDRLQLHLADSLLRRHDAAPLEVVPGVEFRRRITPRPARAGADYAPFPEPPANT